MTEAARTISQRLDRGFTLLEVLVAFAILTVALGGLLLAFSDGLRMAQRSVAVSNATLQAQSLMEEVGKTIPVRPGRVTGTLDDGSRWQVTVAPFDTGESGAAAVVRSLFAFRVDVTIEWDGGRSLTLSSLRLAPDDA